MIMCEIIGRKKEIAELKRYYESGRAEFVAVYGRRRVGKYNFSYADGDIWFEWSPDSKWLMCSYIGNGGWNNTEYARLHP